MSELLIIVILLIVIGVVLWLVNTYLPMDPKIRQLINVLVVVALVIWLIIKFLVPLVKGL